MKKHLETGLIGLALISLLVGVGFYVAQWGRTQEVPPDTTTTADATASTPECSDGLDNDNDGAIDHPADPGCESADDADELSADECLEGIQNRCSNDTSLACGTDEDCGAGNTCSLVQTNAACPSAESIFASDTSAYAQIHKVSPTCQPPYTVLNPKTKDCELRDEADGVVDGKVVLKDTISLSSFTKLNCKGLTLVPKETGTVGQFFRFCSNDAGIKKIRCTTNAQCGTGGTCLPLPTFKRSMPELAFLIKESYGVKLQNCTIGTVDKPFDFGVFVLNAKLPEDAKDDPGAQSLLRNKILNNTIAARYTGVTLVKTDNSLTADNDITSGIGSRIARGVGIYRDSDGNRVANNTIQAHSTIQGTLGPEVPQGSVVQVGGIPRLVFTNPLRSPVVNFVYDSQLTQIPRTKEMLVSPLQTWFGSCLATKKCSENTTITCNTDYDCGLKNESFTAEGHEENNIVEGNTLDMLPQNTGFFQFGDGIGAIGGLNNTYSNNIIKAADNGFQFFRPREEELLAGTCRGNSVRYCSTDADCMLLGNDYRPCQGAVTASNSSVGPKGALLENNKIVGPVIYYGINFSHATADMKAVGNDVSGAKNVGILVEDNALENSQVIRNKLHGNGIGLGLRTTGPNALPTNPQHTPKSFGALVTLNDITDNQSQALGDGVCTNELVKLCATNADCGGSTCIHKKLFNEELSSAGSGSYWGRTCSDSQGFRDVDEPDAAGKTDSPSSLITDSHPYGQSVTGTPGGSLPATCK